MAFPILALLPLVSSILPSLATKLLGNRGGEIAEGVLGAAKEIFGTDDPTQLEKAIARDPAAALSFKSKLLDIQDAESKRQHEERIEEIKDKQSARAMHTTNRDPIVTYLAIGTLAVFVLINTLTLIGAYFLITAPPGSIKVTEFTIVVSNIIGQLLMWVNLKADSIYQFFFGSSHGSKEKTEAFSSAMTKMSALIKR